MWTVPRSEMCGKDLLSLDGIDAEELEEVDDHDRDEHQPEDHQEVLRIGHLEVEDVVDARDEDHRSHHQRGDDERPEERHIPEG